MKKNDGLTLVEIIISIAILGIMSIGFLSFLSNHFTILNHTKEISQNAFSTQREIEEEIDNVKDKIRNNELTLKNMNIFSSLGGINVKYYEVEKIYNNKKFSTLVSDIKPELIEPIDLDGIGIKLLQGLTEVDYGYSTGGFEIVGNFSNANKYKWDHLLNVVEWYVSKEGFNIPMPKHPDFNLEDDMLHNSYYFPMFPRDYILVSNHTINNFGNHNHKFPKLENYRGRHIIFTATPAAKSGKIGVQNISRPIFVSGIPITRNLIAHFDANYIDSYNNSEVEPNGTVKKWLDISSVYGNAMPIEAATPINEKPILLKTTMDSGNRWQYVNFENNQRLKIDNRITQGNQIYVFGVARKLNENAYYFASNGYYQFSIPEQESKSEWFFIKESINSLDNSLILGGDGIDISEIAVFSSEMTFEEIIMVEEYFGKKYNNPSIIGEIKELLPGRIDLKEGEPLTLPRYIEAEMTRGYRKTVAVSWDEIVFNGQLGEHKFKATSLIDKNKDIEYTVIVSE